MFVRKVKKEDSKKILEIRNHPIARQYSNNQEEIPFEQHDAWFNKKYFSGAENYCFVLENNYEAVGYCRFDLDQENDCYVISIAIDVNCRANGLGSLLLSESLKNIITDKKITAETLKDNIPSVKLFRKNNFEVYKEDDKNYYFKYSRLII